MMNENNYSTNPCKTCGRPWAPIRPACPTFDGCACEYCGTMPACFKNKQPDCLAKAVIPSITVDEVSGITTLANCLVHVTSINTTYYVDDKHRIMTVWAGPVEVDVYDIETNTLNLRSQTCFTTINGVYTEVYFDKQGVGHIMGTEA